MLVQRSLVASSILLLAGMLTIAAAQEKPLSKSLTNSLGMKLALVPAGEFAMGAPESDRLAAGNERPQHRVRITRPFYLGVYEVTVGQFRQFVQQSGHKTDAEKGGDTRAWNNPFFNQTDDHPVMMVSWNDASAFCTWLGRKERKTYRLPAEAEWEYACRAGSVTRYSYGDDPQALGASAWIGGKTGNAGAKTHPVGQKKPNAWGLYDLHGNVLEWCADRYSDTYDARASQDDPTGPESGDSRVVRGGSWGTRPRDARSACRSWYKPGLRYMDLGFRVVLAP
jgi:formylglycine-generating enzyme required for sulfatase activity